MIIFYGIKVKKADGSWDWDQRQDGKPFLFSEKKEHVENMALSIFKDRNIEYKVEEYSRKENLYATPFGIVVKKIKENIFQGNWDCENSPNKKCNFNVKEDPACDTCIYCGEPEERF